MNVKRGYRPGGSRTRSNRCNAKKGASEMTRMMAKIGVAVAIVLVLTATPLSAEWEEYPQGGIEIDVPSEWIVTEDDETGVLLVEVEDGSVAIVFWIPDDTWEGAIAALDMELETIIEYPTLEGDPVEGELNDMLLHERSGLGTVGGDTVSWSLKLVGAHKPVIALAFASPSVWEASQASVEEILQTMRLLDDD